MRSIFASSPPRSTGLCHGLTGRVQKAILHRKNALFYKTENSARVGDLFMGLIHTAELCQADPFDYLVSLQRHHPRVSEDPEAWLPWNYQTALDAVVSTGDEHG